MFRLSQSTRRRLFRTGFLLVCVAPLVALVAAGWRQHLSGYVHAHENALRHALGRRVHIGQVIHPRPGVVRYQDLQLADAETGHTFAKFRMAEIREPVGAGKPAELVVQGTTIEPGAATSLFGMIEELLRGSFRSEDLYLTFSTDAIKFDETTTFPELKSVSGSIHATDKKAEALVEFHTVEPETALATIKPANAATSTTKSKLPTGIQTANTQNKVVLRMVRSRQNGEAVEGFELNTGSVAVPCEMLTPLAAGELIGLDGSHFHGSVWASHEEAGWWVEVRGDLLAVNLQRLVGNRFGHRIDGTVDVQIHQSHSVNGRLTEADLTIYGGPGRISRSLLAAASNALQLGSRCSPTPPEDLYDYKQLAARGRLNKAGEIEIIGGCTLQDGRATDVVLMSPDDKAWWREPPRSEPPQPVSALLRALAAADSPSAPANSQIGWLMARLPIETTARPDPPREPPLAPIKAPQKQRESQTQRVVPASKSQEPPITPGLPGPYGK